MDAQPMLTVQDASRETGLSEVTIRSAMARNRIPFVEMYGRKLIRRVDMESYRRTARRGRPRKARPEVLNSEAAYERAMVNAGLYEKHPRPAPTPADQRFMAPPIPGKPVSEQILEDRR